MSYVQFVSKYCIEIQAKVYAAYMNQLKMPMSRLIKSISYMTYNAHS